MSEPPTAPVEQARAYYRALDEGDYELLAALLADGFVHDRPDRTTEGRERFVRFMREERPQTDTTHPVDTVFEADGSEQSSGLRPSSDQQSDGSVAVRGRLLDADGTQIVAFVDVFEFSDGRITRIETYTR
jgi:ketosteroid isomerase-like protein